jgi:hypothetical protein
LRVYKGELTMNKDTVIYNLILMLNDNFDTQDIDTQSFIDYICEEADIPEAEYRRIMDLG